MIESLTPDKTKTAKRRFTRSISLKEVWGNAKSTIKRQHFIFEIINRQNETPVSNGKALFTTNGILDEAAFQQTRNRLGMVLLLKDKLNLSSNDEIYIDKLITYSGSNLIWNIERSASTLLHLYQKR